MTLTLLSSVQMTQPEVLIQVLEILKKSRKFCSAHVTFWLELRRDELLLGLGKTVWKYNIRFVHIPSDKNKKIVESNGPTKDNGVINFHPSSLFKKTNNRWW